MGRRVTDEVLIALAAKWFGACAALTTIGALFLWFGLDASGPRSPDPSPGAQDSRARRADEQAFPAAKPVPFGRKPAAGQSSEARTAVGGELAPRRARAGAAPWEERGGEIAKYDENIATFDARLAQLEAELAAGKAARQTQAGLLTQLERTLEVSARLPSRVSTRCSDGVCEISLAGAGSAFDFAMTAAETLLSVATKAARGQAEDSFVAAFNRDQAIRGQVTPAAPSVAQTPPPATEPEAIRAIRFLLDVSDLAPLARPER